MHPRKMSVAKMLAALRESRSSNWLGPVGVALGIVLVGLGWILEEESVGIGGAVRTLGGLLFLGGLALVVLGDPRRRSAAIGLSERICARYMSRTANWGWPDRVGLAGVVIGLALVIPAVVLQIIFRSGAIVAVPAVILFWGGVILLIYGRFYGRRAMDTGSLPSSTSRRERRGGGRL